MRYLLLIFALVLFFVWIGSFVLFHVTGVLLHIILLVALVLFIAHFFGNRRSA
jgi:hypothetical protein